jgi:hypothetical protein
MAKSSSASGPRPTPRETQLHWLEGFRAHLHIVITAGQTGQQARLAQLPGPGMQAYARALARLPDNALAAELVKPVWAIFNQIENAATGCGKALKAEALTDPAQRAELEQVREQLDFALALVLRQLSCLVRSRAETTQCRDLLCDAIGLLGIGDGPAAARWLRRWQQEFPENNREADGTMSPESFPDLFAWEAYQRIAALDELADEFPEQLQMAAKQMHAWPMLMHRHTDNRRRFEELAEKLQLGAEYPLDASAGARFRPDTPMVRYLDPRVCRLNFVRTAMADTEWKTEEQESESLRWWWGGSLAKLPGDEVLPVLRRLRDLPPLTKATASQWAEKAVVPMILATDARDWRQCAEPVLQRIANQRGVKSRATFKSRLLAAVAATLRRRARP